MWRRSLASSSGATLTTRPIADGSPGLRASKHLPRPIATLSRLLGGFDFEAGDAPLSWTPQALPTVIGVTATPPRLAGPSPRADARALPGAMGLRVAPSLDGAADAALLPFDEHFPIRAAAALRVWRALVGRKPGPDPQALTAQRRNRLILALRALDGRRAHASYRQLAEVLFGPLRLRGDADWNSHDVRDRTIRLARLGFELAQGGYRRLLLHPNRRLR
jgi:hypothetical protein